MAVNVRLVALGAVLLLASGGFLLQAGVSDPLAWTVGATAAFGAGIAVVWTNGVERRAA